MYTEITAEKVLANVERRIANGYSVPTRMVCEELSIFDWWTETLSVSKLKQMRSFLKKAIELGFTGYVCFKVGASGCANGMWAYTELSTDGYSPKIGDVLYRSFTPDYTTWAICFDGEWSGAGDEQEMTLKDIERACANRKEAIM